MAWPQSPSQRIPPRDALAARNTHLTYVSMRPCMQIMLLLDKLEQIDAERAVSYISGLQQPDGSFAGDEW